MTGQNLIVDDTLPAQGDNRVLLLILDGWGSVTAARAI